MSDVPQRLLTTAELATRLHVSRRTVARWVKEGILRPTFTMPSGGYRWNLADAERQLAEREPGQG